MCFWLLAYYTKLALYLPFFSFSFLYLFTVIHTHTGKT